MATDSRTNNFPKNKEGEMVVNKNVVPAKAEVNMISGLLSKIKNKLLYWIIKTE